MIKVFDAKKELLHEVLDFIETELTNHDCNMKTQMTILINVEELYINIASYAYKGITDDGKAEISIDFEGDDVIIVLKDQGHEFNPLDKPDPDITLSAEERGIGGLGIYMVKKTMDDVWYKREDDSNILGMRKSIH